MRHGTELACLAVGIILAINVALWLLSTGVFEVSAAVESTNIGSSASVVASGTRLTSSQQTRPFERASSQLNLGQLFRTAADRCDGLDWEILAGISLVESAHGQMEGRRVLPSGRVFPPIFGVPLDGSAGLSTIADTDRGVVDQDDTWDRAVGPMQFIPSSWQIYGIDGDGDGLADPQNFFDAVPAAVAHLCPDGRLDDVPGALLGYNPDPDYVTKVLDGSRWYRQVSTLGR